MVLGISNEKVYVAVGRDALKLLKEAIAKSKAAAGKEVPPMQFGLPPRPLPNSWARFRKVRQKL